MVVAMALPALTAAQVLDLKGLKIGMSKAEVQERFPTWNDFTIGGVRSKFTHIPLNIKYQDDKLEQLMFLFNSASFQQVLDALKEKYPALKCEASKVGNAMGASFEQVQCSIEDQESVLQLFRFLSDVRTSMLILESKKSINEKIEKEKQKKKDI